MLGTNPPVGTRKTSRGLFPTMFLRHFAGSPCCTNFCLERTLVPVGLCEAQIHLSALAKTSRGFSLHFAAAPDFPPRSPTFARAQVTASAETPLGDEMQRTAAWGCSFSLVPVVGLEPTRILLHRILSPARLPISPHRRK